MRVRSDARNERVNARETFPSPIWSYRSNSVIDSSKSPAPVLNAFSTETALTELATTNATSCTVAGRFHIFGAALTLASGSSLKIAAKAQVRSGRFKAAITRGCSSPAWATGFPSTLISAHRPGCHGARSLLTISNSFPVASTISTTFAIASLQIKIRDYLCTWPLIYIRQTSFT